MTLIEFFLVTCVYAVAALLCVGGMLAIAYGDVLGGAK